MKAVLLALLMLCCPLRLARAQAVKVALPAAAPAPASVLTPAQAQAVLDVLGNDAKRQQFVAVLRNIAKVQAATAPKAAGIPLTPGSLGAELLAGASGAVGRASAALIGSARTLTDFPLFRSWVVHVASDPASRMLLFGSAWRLAAVALAGGLAEFAARRGAARWRDGVNRAVPHEDPSTIVPDGQADPPARDAAGPDADARHSRVRPDRPTSWGLLRRLPYALLRLLIDAVPVAAFAAVALGLLAGLGASADMRAVVLGVLDAYLLVRLLMVLTHMMLAPRATSLRLVHVSDASAMYMTRWLVRFFAVAIFGYTLDQVALSFGLYQALHDALLRVIALVLHGFALVVVLQCRRKVARHLGGPRAAAGGGAMLRRRLAETWHVAAIFLIVASWVVFAFEVRNGYVAMWRFFADAAVVLGVTRLLSILLLGALDRALRLRPETVARFPGLDERADRYHPVLRLLLNAVLFVVAAFVLLRIWGVPLGDWFRRGSLSARVVDALVTSGLVVLVAVLLWEGINALVQGHLASLARDGQLARSARLRTLLPMLRTTLFAIISVFAALTVLSQVGVNTAPLLAARAWWGSRSGSDRRNWCRT